MPQAFSYQSPRVIFTQSFYTYYYVMKETETQKRLQVNKWESKN